MPLSSNEILKQLSFILFRDAKEQELLSPGETPAATKELLEKTHAVVVELIHSLLLDAAVPTVYPERTALLLVDPMRLAKKTGLDTGLVVDLTRLAFQACKKSGLFTSPQEMGVIPHEIVSLEGGALSVSPREMERPSTTDGGQKKTKATATVSSARLLVQALTARERFPERAFRKLINHRTGRELLAHVVHETLTRLGDDFDELYFAHIETLDIPDYEALSTRFNHVAPAWNARHRTLERLAARSRRPERHGNQVFRLHRFGRPIDQNEVLSWARQSHCHVATLVEGLAFDAVHRKIQDGFSIIMLGTFTMYGNEAYSPMFRHDQRRFHNLSYTPNLLTGSLSGEDYFLFVAD